MKRLLQFLPVIVGAMLLTGCFEIKQKVDFKNDGTGYYTFTFSFGEMGKMMMERAQSEDPNATLTAILDSSDEFSFTSELEELAAVDGITNVTSWEDADAGSISVGMNFDNVDALNYASAIMMSDSMYDEILHTFSFEKGGFFRKDKFGFTGYDRIQKEMLKAMTAEEDSTQEMVRMMFGDLAFITEVTFESEIEEVDNENVLLNGNRKGVVLRYRPFNEEDQKLKTAFEVKLD